MIKLSARISMLLSTLLFISALLVLLIVWVSTFRFVTEQLDRKLEVGLNVLEQALTDREQMLVNSAQVLTSDFAFRGTVATNDRETIGSVLNNHGERINADLMAILNLEGAVTVSVGSDVTQISTSFIEDAVEKVMWQGSTSGFVSINGRLYQVVLVSVNAPRPIAVALLGFQLDKALAQQLKMTTGLEISFVVNNEKTNDVLSTLGDIEYSWLESTLELTTWHIPYVRTGKYTSTELSLKSTETSRIGVFLSESLDEIYQEFDYLQLKILVVSLVIIPFALFLAFLFSRNITRPIERLVDAAKFISAGEFKSEIKTSTQTQEISDLENAFGSMQKALLVREERITHQASHDQITGLLNRDAIICEAQVRLDSNTEGFRLVGFCLINIGQINAVFGPTVADDYLCKIGQELTGHYACVARISGGRFFCIPERLMSASEINDQCELITSNIEESDLNMNADVRAGFVEPSSDLRDAAHMVSRLHITLDGSETEGRVVAEYEQGQEQAYAARLTLVENLRLLLNNDPGSELQMYYQPKMHLGTGEVTRMEALIRWFDKDGKFIPPDEFIPLAEQSGLINDLTEWVIEDVVRQLKNWKQDGHKFCVAINLSAQDIGRPDMRPFIHSCLEKYGVSPGELILEVTESELMRQPEQAIALLREFREEGFSIAIDDFGTGYSSLAQLKNMPVTELKIDREFVMKLTDDNDDKIIVKSTIELAHRFGLEVVAEGVEDQGALDLLSDLNCEWAQGYFISRPMAAHALQEWLETESVKRA